MIRPRLGERIEELALPRARVLIDTPPQALYGIPEIRDRDDFISRLVEPLQQLPPRRGAAQTIFQVQRRGQCENFHACTRTPGPWRTLMGAGGWGRPLSFGLSQIQG